MLKIIEQVNKKQGTISRKVFASVETMIKFYFEVLFISLWPSIGSNQQSCMRAPRADLHQLFGQAYHCISHVLGFLLQSFGKSVTKKSVFPASSFQHQVRLSNVKVRTNNIECATNLSSFMNFIIYGKS